MINNCCGVNNSDLSTRTNETDSVLIKTTVVHGVKLIIFRNVLRYAVNNYSRGQS